MSDTDGRDPVQTARHKAFVLYEGVRTPHRSCGICLAETFGRTTAPYQSLRRGGITGEGECGALKAGELVLGEILGDPRPDGPVTDALRSAIVRYRDRWQQRLAGVVGSDIICNRLTAPFGDFQGAERRAFCTRIAADAAAAVAETLQEAGVEPPVEPLHSDED